MRPMGRLGCPRKGSTPMEAMMSPDVGHALFDPWIRVAGGKKGPLEVGEEHLLRALRDLCSGDVEPYPVDLGDANGLPNLLLVDPRGRS